MRKRLIYSILCCIAVATMVVACTHEGDEGAVTITPNKTNVSFTAESTSEPVVITTSAAWTIVNTTDWLTIEPTSGVGITTIFLTVANNETTIARNTSLTVSAEGVTTAATISVSQSGMSTTLPAQAGVITGLGSNDCPNTNTIDLTAEPISGATSYVWYHNGTIIYNITGLTYTATEGGVYTYAGKNTLGVGSPSGEKRIVIEECFAPDMSGDIQGGDEIPCERTPVTLTIDEIANATSYQWYKDGEAIAGANTTTYVATEGGTYTVTGINILFGEGPVGPEKVITQQTTGCKALYADELVGDWDVTEFIFDGSSGVYNGNHVLTITKVDETNILIRDFGIDFNGATTTATINQDNGTILLGGRKEIIPTWYAGYRTYVCPAPANASWGGGWSQTFAAITVEKDPYVITLPQRYNVGSIGGVPAYSTWVMLASTNGTTSAGYLYIFLNTVWTKQTPNPAPASIRAVDLPKMTKADIKLHVD